MTFNINDLIDKAIEARNKAYVPYSNFKVGSALLLKNGEYVLGCNVENASYGLCNCAERTALFKAYSEGLNKDDIVAMSIAGATDNAISPCGACRQVMVELLPQDCKIYMVYGKDINIVETSIKELVPFAFSSEDLNND